MREGMKTTEFHLAVGTTLVCTLVAIYAITKNVDLGDAALLLGAISAPCIAYTGGRSYVKKRPTDILPNTSE